MELGDLAVELLEMIIENVWPNDLVAFSLTCRQIHTLATLTLRIHQQLHAKYSRMELSDESLSPGPLEWLLDLSSDPRRSLYPQHLTISPFYIEQNEIHQAHATLVRQLGVLNAHSLIPRFREQTETLHNVLDHGNEDVFLAFCLGVLPNLKTLCLLLGPSTWKLNHTAALLRGMARFCTPQSQFLQLSKVTLDFDSRWHPYEAANALTAFMVLPKLKTINCSGLRLEYAGSWTDLPRTSNVEELCLMDSLIASTNLSSLLTSIPNLKTFKYSLLYDDYTYNPISIYNFHPRSICFTLLQSSKDTLETLHLDCIYKIHWKPTKWYWYQLIGSLSDFTALKSITLHAALFLHRFTSKFNQWKMLPKSLEQLNIIGLVREKKDRVRQLFRAIPDLYNIKEGDLWSATATIQMRHLPLDDDGRWLTRTYEASRLSDPELILLVDRPHERVECLQCVRTSVGKASRIAVSKRARLRQVFERKIRSIEATNGICEG